MRRFIGSVLVACAMAVGVLGSTEGCATVQPGEFAAVQADFAAVAADVTAMAAENMPEYVTLRKAIEDKNWMAAFTAAISLADSVEGGGGPLVADVERLIADVKKLFTKDEAEVAQRVHMRMAQARAMRPK